MGTALALLLPPAGLLFLLLPGVLPPGNKRRAVIYTSLYTLMYVVLVIWLLIRFAGLQIEWKGGFPPVLTFEKTVPDYEALERHRVASTNAASVPATNGSIYWTGFRGPRRDGHYDQHPIQTNLPAGGLKPIWKQPIGGGYSSFAIAKGVAYTIEQRRDNEAVTAYDLKTGRELWAQTYPARFEEWMGGEGPRATPAWDDGRIYSLGAEGHLLCLDAQEGTIIWKTNILRMAGADLLPYAVSASPLIDNEKLIVLPGGPGNSVMALNKVTGKKIWGSLDDKPAYVSPMLVELAGVKQLLIVTAHRAAGLNPENGNLLWFFPWPVQYDNNIAQPVLTGTNRFVLSAGYGTGSVAVEVTQTDGKLRAQELWRNKRLKNKFASSVYHEGYIYGLDEDILTCLDAQTGQQQWKDGRYGYGQLILASGHLVIIGGEGKLTLVQANPGEHIVVASFPAIHGKTWNHPAMSDGLLLVRNAVEAACFDLR